MNQCSKLLTFSVYYLQKYLFIYFLVFFLHNYSLYYISNFLNRETHSFKFRFTHPSTHMSSIEIITPQTGSRISIPINLKREIERTLKITNVINLSSSEKKTNCVKKIIAQEI
jgi:hypothetical protein